MPRRGAAFTIPTPEPLPAEHDGEHWWMDVDGRRLRLSNLDKVFWPTERYTKGDLLAYYYNVAPSLLPYLRGRPLTMKRMPNGIEGDFFYEKSAPSHTPEWIRRCPVASDDSKKKVIDYLTVDDTAGILFVANLGCIEFHPLHSRCESVTLPDYLFFDLDPFEPATFEDVRIVARHVRAALDAMGLPSYPKTSGATGMQIYVPVVPGPTYDQVRAFVGTLGQAILRADPDRVTMEWDTKKRDGKVFIDHNMNRQGANISAVYSVRPERGGTVSTPVTWDEVEAGIQPLDFTMANVHDRLAELGDLFRPVLDQPIDVRPALERLGIAVDDDPGSGAQTSAETDAQAQARLAEYRRKRDFAGTPEPAPGSVTDAGDTFVIQKHDATRLHYDLRLERAGVLVSWAVPKGLPTEPGERRLAVQTEDHPLEYGGFEGWIPEGHYGAGEVKIFDRGTYDALEWTDDKVTFRLHGSRHRGEYHLVKTKQGWLVFLSRRSADEQPDEPPSLSPMLAEPWKEAFDDDGWRFEPKLDGIRTLAYISTAGTRLVSRTGRDHTAQYPELNNLARFVNALSAVIDGEIVALDEGRPSFERLQQRMNLSSPRDVEKQRRLIPVVLYAFDVLWIDGRDLTGEPLEERRAALDDIVTPVGPLLLTATVDGEGKALFERARDLGFEGIIAKKLGSRYVPGRRSRDWRKVKAVNTQDCVVLGWTPGTGSRSRTFGALLVGAYDEGTLRWIGQVGTGFTEAVLDDLLDRLRGLEADEPAVDRRSVASVKGAHWVRPELVCEVEYLEMTKAGKLRAPSFKGLRPDKLPADCILER